MGQLKRLHVMMTSGTWHKILKISSVVELSTTSTIDGVYPKLARMSYVMFISAGRITVNPEFRLVLLIRWSWRQFTTARGFHGRAGTKYNKNPMTCLRRVGECTEMNMTIFPLSAVRHYYINNNFMCNLFMSSLWIYLDLHLRCVIITSSATFDVSCHTWSSITVPWSSVIVPFL